MDQEVGAATAVEGAAPEGGPSRRRRARTRRRVLRSRSAFASSGGHGEIRRSRRRRRKIVLFWSMVVALAGVLGYAGYRVSVEPGLNRRPDPIELLRKDPLLPTPDDRGTPDLER
jgi:hypothetical protein